MAFSKFDPHRPHEPVQEFVNDSARRRAMIIKWASWITMVWTAIGFGFILYWLAK